MKPELVKLLVLRNDNEARRELFEAFYRRTYAVVYYILRSHENAEDITQEAFIKAFQKLDQLVKKEKFAAWLAAIASNLARNFLKREKKIIVTSELPEIKTSEQFSSPEDEALNNIETDNIRRAIRSLPPEQYQVVALFYYHDLKVEEIGTMLKISTGTVKSRLFRARQKMAALLEPISTTGGHHNKERKL